LIYIKWASRFSLYSGQQKFFLAEIKGMFMGLRSALIIGTLLFAWAGGASSQAVDASAAEALAKKSGCLKCHSVSAKKEGPPFKETAAKYQGKADAEQKLYTHLTTNPKVKVDGKEELHDNLKTKNENDIRNVVRWILSR
jgi:cytochrome c